MACDCGEEGFRGLSARFGRRCDLPSRDEIARGSDRSEIFPGYLQFWSYAEKKGYSGTAIFTRRELRALHGLGVPELDTEGRIVALGSPSFGSLMSIRRTRKMAWLV